MHDDMQYDPIQGQVYKSLKVGNPSKAIFSSICKWQLATDHCFLNYSTIYNI